MMELLAYGIAILAIIGFVAFMLAIFVLPILGLLIHAISPKPKRHLQFIKPTTETEPTIEPTTEREHYCDICGIWNCRIHEWHDIQDNEDELDETFSHELGID